MGDRIYGTYTHIAGWTQRQVDVVFRQGKRLGKQDRLVRWTKPKQRPKNLTPEAYPQLPCSTSIPFYPYWHWRLRSIIRRKGDCWDNRVAESFCHLLKTELVYHTQ